jgi:hypothetical protein
VDWGGVYDVRITLKLAFGGFQSARPVICPRGLGMVSRCEIMSSQAPLEDLLSMLNSTIQSHHSIKKPSSHLRNTNLPTNTPPEQQ